MTNKYKDFTNGQIEAVFNKIGGPEAVRRFLRDEIILADGVPCQLPIWLHARQGHIGCATVAAQKLTEAGILRTSNECYVEDVLSEISYTQDLCEVPLCKVTLRELGFSSSKHNRYVGRSDDVFVRARIFGLSKVESEMVVILPTEHRDELSLENMKGEKVVIASEYTTVGRYSSRLPCIFSDGGLSETTGSFHLDDPWIFRANQVEG